MRQLLNLVSALSFVLTVSLGCAHMGDPCDNDLVERVTSPDGSLVVSVYSRRCPSALYTYVAMEKPPPFLRSRGEVVCHLVNWGRNHPVEVEWKDSTNVFLSTSDELSDFDLLGDTPQETCNNINIEYSIPGYPRPAVQVADLESVPDMIAHVLDELGPCIDDFSRGGNPSSDIVSDIKRYARTGLESLAVGTIIRFSDAAKCDMSDSTRTRLTRLAQIYKQREPGSRSPDTVTVLPAQP